MSSSGDNLDLNLSLTLLVSQMHLGTQSHSSVLHRVPSYRKRLNPFIPSRNSKNTNIITSNNTTNYSKDNTFISLAFRIQSRTLCVKTIWCVFLLINDAKCSIVTVCVFLLYTHVFINIVYLCD